MFYLSSVIKCFLMIYILKEVSQVFARHKSHSTKYKVDEFIDKLLNSKKLDILAEKFAQKAVERMFNLKPTLRFTEDSTAQNDAAQKVAFNNVSYKTDVHLEQTSSSLKNLSLRFRHFTKGAFFNINTEENIDTHVEEAENPVLTNSTNIQVQGLEEDDNESINISDLESSFQDKLENTPVNLKHTVARENENLLYKNKTTEQEVNDGSISMENKKNAEFLSETEPSEIHKTNESLINDVTSDFDKNVRKDRALFSNESTEALKGNESKQPRKKRIHKEGNRLYTFQSSSEYEEYHQELERVEKERNVFV